MVCKIGRVGNTQGDYFKGSPVSVNGMPVSKCLGLPVLQSVPPSNVNRVRKVG